MEGSKGVLTALRRSILWLLQGLAAMGAEDRIYYFVSPCLRIPTPTQRTQEVHSEYFQEFFPSVLVSSQSRSMHSSAMTSLSLLLLSPGAEDSQSFLAQTQFE